jgi:hypothetical protein
METPAGPTPLAMPADRTTAVTRVPQQVVASDAITLLNGATKRGVVVAFEGGSPAGAWATVTVSTGEVPVRLDLYQDVGELEPDAGSSVTDTLTLIADADVEGAEQPREHRADVIEIEDDQFGLHREGTLSEYVRDETAADGWAARQLGSDKEWSIQHRLDPGLFEPGAAYRLYAVVKIDKRGDAGKAFDYGVYDTVRKQAVLYGNRSAADMPDGEWQTVELGSVTPQQGQYAWTAPPQNGENVEWVYVDRFYLVKE